MTDVLRSEWTKIRSVRSTLWTLAATAALMLGIAALFGLTTRSIADGPVTASDAITISLNGGMLAALAMATLGALVISGEYRTGSIRGSFMAVPRRLRLLTGKIVVFTAVSLVVCLLASAAAIGVGLAILRPEAVSLGDVAWGALSSGLFLTACGLFGLALGALIRHTPGAIVSAIALMLVLPPITTQLPGEWGATVSDYFTTNAGNLIVSGQANGSLGPWSGFGVYLAWIAVVMVAGAVLMRRRDA